MRREKPVDRFVGRQYIGQLNNMHESKNCKLYSVQYQGGSTIASISSFIVFIFPPLYDNHFPAKFIVPLHQFLFRSSNLRWNLDGGSCGTVDLGCRRRPG